MNRITGLLLAATGIGIVIVAWAGPEMSPASPAEIANRVTSFSSDHPDWTVLRMQDGEPARDKTTITMSHAGHLARTHADGSEVSCSSCHQLDATGRYMQPISFEQHCFECHDKHLYELDTYASAPSYRVPHEQADEVAAAIEAYVEGVAGLSMRDSEVNGAIRAEIAESEQEESSGGRRRRGRSSAANEETVSTAAVEDPSNPISSAQWAAWRDHKMELYQDLASKNCESCHRVDRDVEVEGFGASWRVQEAAIPSIWLTRSVFSHDAHSMLDCLQCHESSADSTSSRDIMLPGIDSCRQCHSPQGGAPDGCVLCHTYHQKLDHVPPRDLTIQQLLGRQAASSEKTAGEESPDSEATSSD